MAKRILTVRLHDRKCPENVKLYHLVLILNGSAHTFFPNQYQTIENSTVIKIAGSLPFHYKSGLKINGFPGTDIFSVK